MSGKLIITADDYGLCDSVNRGIEECLNTGTVRATCVMANMAACEDASSLRKHFPNASIGIHWNLTQGKSLLGSAQVSTLIGADGSFLSASRIRRQWLRRCIDPVHIRRELTAQYHKFCAIAGQADFWNTHQNVHVFPGLFDLFVSVGQELGIPAMRCHRRLTIPFQGNSKSHNLRHPMYWLKGKVIANWSSWAESRGTSMPDARLYTPGYNGQSASALEEIVGRLQWSSVKKAVEYVVHPATSIHDELFGSLTESRIVEYRALRKPTLAERLRCKGVEIVGFDAVGLRGD